MDSKNKEGKYEDSSITVCVRARPLSFQVRLHPTISVHVQGLKDIPVTSSDAGNAQRRVARTNMMFQVDLMRGPEMISEVVSNNNLVDLAGSERAKCTGAKDNTLKEGSQINKSLTVLGVVMEALAKESSGGKRKTEVYILYRDSTLTFLLKESLGGNSKTLMLATIRPAAHVMQIVPNPLLSERSHIKKLETTQIGFAMHPGAQKSSTGLAAQDVSVMNSELHAEELTQRMIKSTGVVKLRLVQTEPYFLNVGGAGCWIIQYFVKDTTYVSARNAVLQTSGASDTPREIDPSLQRGSTILTVPEPQLSTFVNEKQLEAGQQHSLVSGDDIAIGDPPLEFRFMDPAAPPAAGRRLPATPRAISSARGSVIRQQLSVVEDSEVLKAPQLRSALYPPPSSESQGLQVGRVRSSSFSASTGGWVGNHRAATPVTGARRRAVKPRTGSWNGVSSDFFTLYHHNFVFFGPPFSGATKNYPGSNKSTKLNFYELGGTLLMHSMNSAAVALADPNPTDAEYVFLEEHRETATQLLLNCECPADVSECHEDDGVGEELRLPFLRSWEELVDSDEQLIAKIVRDITVGDVKRFQETFNVWLASSCMSLSMKPEGRKKQGNALDKLGAILSEMGFSFTPCNHKCLTLSLVFFTISYRF
eukprot:gene8413-5894_t